MNEINRTEFEFEKDTVYFKWFKPKEPNGIIFKYNIKLVDVISNRVSLILIERIFNQEIILFKCLFKTQGPLCHASLENLNIALNNFLLTEDHDYFIQVQAVSTGGEGPWSIPIVYRAPRTLKRRK